VFRSFPHQPTHFTLLSRSSFLLLASVLIGFFSAIIDLARVCFEHQNQILSRTTSQGLIQVLLIFSGALVSVATGLRFLFFWAYVSQPPLCEQGSASFLSMHSGSWLHWGWTGSLLRWSTLSASLMILILQSLWRTAKHFHKFGPVYDIDGALEITASAIYMVKLLLNAMIVEAPCRRQTLWQYSTTMLALFINMGIGVGNLIECKPFPQEHVRRIVC
jgi:drug/metabolite transporter superfamily protein YnfA